MNLKERLYFKETTSEAKMSKINQGYTSLFEYLSNNFKLFRSLEADYFPEQVERLREFGSRRNNPHPGPSDQLIGSLQPFADMWKDVKITFKPYKSMMYFGYDLLQPFYGIGNVLAGVVNIVAALPVFVGMVAVNFWKTKIRHHNSDEFNYRESLPLKGGLNVAPPSVGGFKERTLADLKMAGTWMLNGVASVIRGVTQIVATPLTYLGRIVVRAFLNSVSSAIWGEPKVEDNPGIKRLVRQGEELLKHHFDPSPKNGALDFYQKSPETALKEMQGIEWDLHRKYRKATTSRHQDTGIHDSIERKYFNETKEETDFAQKKQTALAYLGLFGGKKEAPKDLPSLSVFHGNTNTR